MKRIAVAILVISVLFIVYCNNDNNTNQQDKEGINVFVSILPQKYFVEKLIGDKGVVNVMVKPGSSPATYEPKPSQMKDLSRADMYISIGVPFEGSWMDKIKSANPDMILVESDKGINKRLMAEHTHDDADEKHEEHNTEKKGYDPHIWLSPNLVKKQAKTILEALKKVDSDNSKSYEDNYENFMKEIDEVDKYIKNKLKSVKSKTFMVFHPSWGYFADEYGLKQRAVEIEGKEPSTRELRQLIDTALEKDIKVIFVQPQFSTKSAETIAESIKGKTIAIDPLAENWAENMKTIADTFYETLNK